MNHKLFRIFAAHMAETLKEKTAKGLFWGALNNGATQLVFGIFLARLLSTEDYGIVALISIFTLHGRHRTAHRLGRTAVATFGATGGHCCCALCGKHETIAGQDAGRMSGLYLQENSRTLTS